MAALHLVFRSPGESSALEQCLARAGADDAVLLLEDGVYGAVESAHGVFGRTGAPGPAVFVLVADLEARGLASSCLAPTVRPIDYPGFVALTVAHNPFVSWI
jgi:tRNA 2-thiouridine synthesizing protein B